MQNPQKKRTKSAKVMKEMRFHLCCYLSSPQEVFKVINDHASYSGEYAGSKEHFSIS